MPTLESRIDDLYRLPLDAFVAARTTLAKELKGADQARVKKLKKPTGVPWAVNQVYWHARPVFEALLREGDRLRQAQIATLEGRSADVRRVSQSHRTAIAAAVSKAVALADAAGVHPPRDGLTQTFEALSLEADPSEPPGRLTRPLQPRGFEMLAGVKVSASLSASWGPPSGGPDPATARPHKKPPRPDRREEEAKQRQAAEIAQAERDVEKARASLARAQRAAAVATEELLAAERRLEAARSRRSG